MKYSDVVWGPDEAKGDKLLMKYFVSFPGFERIANGEVRYIIGRKGSGKSAICEYLRQTALTEHSWFHSNVSLRDFPLGTIRDLEDRHMRDKAKYVPVWRYTLLMQLCNLLRRNEALSFSQDWREIDEFLKLNFGTELTFTNTLNVLKERGLKLSLPAGKIALELAGKKAETLGGEFHYQKACDAILNRLKKIENSGRYILFIDELDEGYRAGDPNLRLLLLALLRAVEDLSLDFQNSGFGFQPILALRSDIWDRLEDNDLNKLDDYLIRLRWDTNPDFPMSLRRVADARIKGSLPIADGKDPWLSVVEDDDPRKPKHAESIWKYLVARTMNRPRDIVKFLKLAGSAGQVDRLQFRHISATEKAYSEWLAREIRDEIHTHIPVWREVKGCFTRAGLIFYDTPTPLLKEFEKDSKIKEWLANSKMSSEELLTQLFDFGLVGNIGRTGIFIFKHKNEDALFDMNGRMLVHFGLGKKLSLRAG